MGSAPSSAHRHHADYFGVPLDDVIKFETSHGTPVVTKHGAVPGLVKECVEHIVKEKLHKNIFHLTPVMTKSIEKFKRGGTDSVSPQGFHHKKVEDFGAILVSYLESLPEPIGLTVLLNYWLNLADLPADEIALAVHKRVASLPANNCALFLYLLEFFHDVTTRNKWLHVGDITQIFAPCFFSTKGLPPNHKLARLLSICVENIGVLTSHDYNQLSPKAKTTEEQPSTLPHASPSSPAPTTAPPNICPTTVYAAASGGTTEPPPAVPDQQQGEPVSVRSSLSRSSSTCTTGSSSSSSTSSEGATSASSTPHRRQKPAENSKPLTTHENKSPTSSSSVNLHQQDTTHPPPPTVTQQPNPISFPPLPDELAQVIQQLAQQQTVRGASHIPFPLDPAALLSGSFGTLTTAGSPLQPNWPASFLSPAIDAHNQQPLLHPQQQPSTTVAPAEEQQTEGKQTTQPLTMPATVTTTTGQTALTLHPTASTAERTEECCTSDATAAYSGVPRYLDNKREEERKPKPSVERQSEHHHTNQHHSHQQKRPTLSFSSAYHTVIDRQQQQGHHHHHQKEGKARHGYSDSESSLSYMSGSSSNSSTSTTSEHTHTVTRRIEHYYTNHTPTPDRTEKAAICAPKSPITPQNNPTPLSEIAGLALLSLLQQQRQPKQAEQPPPPMGAQQPNITTTSNTTMPNFFQKQKAPAGGMAASSSAAATGGSVGNMTIQERLYSELPTVICTLKQQIEDNTFYCSTLNERIKELESNAVNEFARMRTEIGSIKREHKDQIDVLASRALHQPPHPIQNPLQGAPHSINSGHFGLTPQFTVAPMQHIGRRHRVPSYDSSSTSSSCSSSTASSSTCNRRSKQRHRTKGKKEGSGGSSSSRHADHANSTVHAAPQKDKELYRQIKTHEDTLHSHDRDIERLHEHISQVKEDFRSEMQHITKSVQNSAEAAVHRMNINSTSSWSSTTDMKLASLQKAVDEEANARERVKIHLTDEICWLKNKIEGVVKAIELLNKQASPWTQIQPELSQLGSIVDSHYMDLSRQVLELRAEHEATLSEIAHGNHRYDSKINTIHELQMDVQLLKQRVQDCFDKVTVNAAFPIPDMRSGTSMGTSDNTSHQNRYRYMGSSLTHYNPHTQGSTNDHTRLHTPHTPPTKTTTIQNLFGPAAEQPESSAQQHYLFPFSSTTDTSAHNTATANRTLDRISASVHNKSPFTNILEKRPGGSKTGSLLTFEKPAAPPMLPSGGSVANQVLSSTTTPVAFDMLKFTTETPTTIPNTGGSLDPSMRALADLKSNLKSTSIHGDLQEEMARLQQKLATL